MSKFVDIMSVQRQIMIELCKMFRLDPKRVRKLTVECECGKPVTYTATFTVLPEDRLLEKPVVRVDGVSVDV